MSYFFNSKSGTRVNLLIDIRKSVVHFGNASVQVPIVGSSMNGKFPQLAKKHYVSRDPKTIVRAIDSDGLWKYPTFVLAL